MSMSEIALLLKIQERIPEFDAEKNDGSWIWTYRCSEAQNGADSLIDSFIDFVAGSLEAADEMMGINSED